jgi:DNA-binding PadR family transcriptional regulator|tara:strand:+ start:14890 stop:15282 length:393 start_codon:yes stop_codon:yes gene_type:complete
MIGNMLGVMATARPDTTFWILTALANGPQHGYGILRSVFEASGGAASLKTATLYATLDRLTASGAVEESGEQIVDGRARRYFRLTSQGVAQLESETAELEQRVAAARRALGTAAGGGARPRPAHPRSALA